VCLPTTNVDETGAINQQDMKVYAIGENYCFAETRKSPVVDGLVLHYSHSLTLSLTHSLKRV
jgi:inositol-hexakisphosphate/diphosphoinositol-pentakisphosphate 1-kinase